MMHCRAKRPNDFIRFRASALVALCMLTAPTAVIGHLNSIDVLATPDGQLTPFLFSNGLPIARPAEFSYFSIADRVLSDSPGFGIINSANRIAPLSVLNLDIASPLLFWDGNAMSTTASEVTIAAPNGIDRYTVSADTSKQTGMHWGVYSGDLFWDADGLYFLDPIPAETGMYGFWAQLSSPDYTTSEPFLLPFMYTPDSPWTDESIDTGVASLLSFNFEVTAGDFNGDDQLDADDIDLLTQAIRAGETTASWDLTGDASIDELDRVFWIEQLVGTYFGDANLDGEFNSADIIGILQSGEYEDDVPGNSTWSTGDFDGDGDFGTGDLVTAFRAAGYEQGPRAATPLAAVSVPEPNLLAAAAIALLYLAVRHR